MGGARVWRTMTRILLHTRAAARVLRHAMTSQERRLRAKLREINRLLGTNFRRQAPVGRFVADFADRGRQIVVEVDDGQHGEAAGARSDALRDASLADQGFAVLRFRTNKVSATMERVMQVILDDAREAARVTPPPRTEDGP